MKSQGTSHYAATAEYFLVRFRTSKDWECSKVCLVAETYGFRVKRKGEALGRLRAVVSRACLIRAVFAAGRLNRASIDTTRRISGMSRKDSDIAVVLSQMRWWLDDVADSEQQDDSYIDACGHSQDSRDMILNNPLHQLPSAWRKGMGRWSPSVGCRPWWLEGSHHCLGRPLAGTLVSCQHIKG